jgi:cyclase
MAWTRRDFLRASAFGLAAGALPRSLLHAAAPASGLVEIRRNVGLFIGRGGTIGWLANGNGALAVDSQFPDTARTFLDALAGRGARRLDVLLNTHHHGDHTAGNAAFREATGRIVAHERVPALQRAAATGDAAAAQVYADTTFAREWSVRIGDETVRARHHGAAHTGGDAVVHFENAGVVHMGDLVFHRAYPFIDRAGGASVVGWIALLEAVAAEYPADTVYVFGHGRAEAGITGTHADVLRQRDLLGALLETARRAHAAGRSREEVTAVEGLPGFDDHAPLSPRLNAGFALGAAYDEVAAAGR